MGKNQVVGLRGVKRVVVLILINIIIIFILSLCAEYYFRVTSSEFRIGKRGWKNGVYHSFGIPTQTNRYRFREKEFVMPKPVGLFRVVVVGNSLVWGVGIEKEDRLTNHLETLLKEDYPGKNIEILNLSYQGSSTMDHASIVNTMSDSLAADVFILGFCSNDVKPGSQDRSPEKDAFTARFSFLLQGTNDLFTWMGMSNLAGKIEEEIYHVAVRIGALPTYTEVTQRAYNKDSEDWHNFVGALEFIYAETSHGGSDTPIFAVLNQGFAYQKPPGYGDPDEGLQVYLGWTRQAEEEAKHAGFDTLNYEKSIAEELPDEDLVVNKWDSHPSATLHRHYAKGLLEHLHKNGYLLPLQSESDKNPR